MNDTMTDHVSVPWSCQFTSREVWSALSATRDCAGCGQNVVDVEPESPAARRLAPGTWAVAPSTTFHNEYRWHDLACA